MGKALLSVLYVHPREKDVGLCHREADHPIERREGGTADTCTLQTIIAGKILSVW